MRIRNEKYIYIYIKTMVHNTQLFYLFVSHRIEEVHTQTIDIHNTYIYATYTQIQSSQRNFRHYLFKQYEWTQFGHHC